MNKEELYLVTYQFTSQAGSVTNHNMIIPEHPAKFIYNCNKEGQGKYVLIFAMPITTEIYHKYYDKID